MKKTYKPKLVVFIIGILLISSLPAIGQIDKNYRENIKKAFAAVSPVECQSSLEFCKEVLMEYPNHPRVNYLAARLNEQLGNSEIAIRYLKKAAKLGYTSQMRWFKIHPLNDPVFSTFREKREFKEIIEIMDKANKPIHNSQTAFTVKDKGLSPEGITYDPVEKMFYLGSDSKIVKVDHLGNSVDFTSEENKDELGAVNGLHVDPVRRILWACSNNDKDAKTEIFKYNVSSGKLIKKYTLPNDGTRHFFNDLVIHPNGDVYITDDTAIYMISQSSDELEVFFKNNSLLGSNGITLSEDGSVIFVAADCLGICKIEIKTRSFTRLTQVEGLNTYGTDGLYFADNYLYTVQNMLVCQINRLKLNAEATHLTSSEDFERNTPYLNAPSTGVIVDDYFYYITFHYRKVDNSGEVIVMKTSIK